MPLKGGFYQLDTGGNPQFPRMLKVKRPWKAVEGHGVENHYWVQKNYKIAIWFLKLWKHVLLGLGISHSFKVFTMLGISFEYFFQIQSLYNFKKTLIGINMFFQFWRAKKGHFATFNVMKNFKMRVWLEIRVLLEGEPH